MPMSGMPYMTPTSLAAVAPRTGKIIKKQSKNGLF